MNSSVCTLFEDTYHNGVAALINSLCHQGYQGVVYAGYRGVLHRWALKAQENVSLQWPGSSILEVTQEITVHFLPLNTSYHLTNYKPDFMLKLWDGQAKEVEAIFYFDPDIVVSAPWTFFEEWVTYGVAVCEDINSPLSKWHPRRMAWRSYFGKKGLELQFKDAIYANGGFVGVSKTNYTFLTTWKTIQELIAPKIGGLNRSALTGTPLPKDEQGPFAPFGKTDQDALNATVEAWAGNVSFVGKDGMGFIQGAPLIPHALGQPKPWKKKFIVSALKGKSPSLVDKAFWLHVKSPINNYNTFYIQMKRIAIIVAVLIGRFYRQNS